MRWFAFMIPLLLLAGAACAAANTVTLSASTGSVTGSVQPTGFPNYCGESLECLIGRSESLVHATALSINSDYVADFKVKEVFKGNLLPGTTIRLSVGGRTIKTGQEALLSLSGVIKDPAIPGLS